MTDTNTNSHSRPWWQYGHVWMVIAGPVIVVIASFVTLYLALTRGDPVVEEDYYRKGLQMNQTLADNPSSLAPAVQGRNHAATGSIPPASKAP